MGLHKKNDILLRWEKENIEYFISVTMKFYKELIDNAKFDFPELPNLDERSKALGSFRYFKNSVLYELNALVELYLIWAAADGGISTKKVNLIRTRAEASNIIHEKYNIKISDLPGFSDIRKLYSAVNANKHRGGIDFPISRNILGSTIQETKTLDFHIEEILNLKESVFTFLEALVNMILLIEYD
jgi:hypothetical protein